MEKRRQKEFLTTWESLNCQTNSQQLRSSVSPQFSNTTSISSCAEDITQGGSRLRKSFKIKALSLSNVFVKLKSLAKNLVCVIFHAPNIRGNVLPKFIELCSWDVTMVYLWGAQVWLPETNRNICLSVLYKCVNTSPEELTNVKVILILRQGMFR